MNRVPIATWDSLKDLWMREPQAKDQRKKKVSLYEHWGVFSATLPTSGTMRNGQLFERQTLVRPTGENECSLLPTPMTTDSEGLADAPGDARRKSPRLSATHHYFPAQRSETRAALKHAREKGSEHH